MARKELYQRLMCYLAGVIIILLTYGCSGRLRHRVEIIPDYPLIGKSMPNLPELQWQEKLFSPPDAMEILNDSTILVFTFRGELFLWNLNSGKKMGNIWQPYREPISSYLIAADRLYIGSVMDGDLTAFNFTTRKKIWRKKKIRVNPDAMAIIGDTLYIYNMMGLLALSTDSGEELNKRKIRNRFTTGLINAGNSLFIFDEKGYLFRYDSGLKLLYKTDLRMGTRIETGFYQKIIAAVDANGRLVVYDLNRNVIVLEKQYDIPIYSQPYLTGQILVVALSNGLVISYNYATGEELWRYQGTGLINLPVRATATEIIVPFARGHIVALSNSTGAELWRYDADNVISHLSLTGNGIILIDRKHLIYFLKIVS